MGCNPILEQLRCFQWEQDCQHRCRIVTALTLTLGISGTLRVWDKSEEDPLNSTSKWWEGLIRLISQNFQGTVWCRHWYLVSSTRGGDVVRIFVYTVWCWRQSAGPRGTQRTVVREELPLQRVCRTAERSRLSREPDHPAQAHQLTTTAAARCHKHHATTATGGATSTTGKQRSLREATRECNLTPGGVE